MNTRTPLTDPTHSVYCGRPADTDDHSPSRCFLRRPLPSNLITFPACSECNAGFSFDENAVKVIVTMVSRHSDLFAERQPGGRVHRASRETLERLAPGAAL